MKLNTTVFLNKNNKILARNIIGAFAVKGVSLIVNVLTIPAYMSFFSDNRILGVWYTILSLLTWILNFDLGIGNGLRNMLVQSFVETDLNKSRRLISSAYILIGIVSLAIIITGSVIIYVSDWNSMLNISSEAISVVILTQSVWLTFVGIMIQFFLKIITSILNAMEKTALSNIIPLTSSISILIFVQFFNTYNDSNNLLNLSLVYVLVVNIPLICTSIILFASRLRFAIPAWRYFDFSLAKNVMKLGGQFFWIQLMFMAITSTNEIIISQLYGPACVVEYQVYNKVFYTCVTLFSLISNPVWSAISKAYYEKRYTWIRKVYSQLNLFACIGCAGVLLIAFAMQLIVNMWLGPSAITVNKLVSALFVVFSGVMMFIFAASSVANGTAELRIQMIGNTFAAFLKIPLCIYLAKIIPEWYSVVIVNILVMIPYAIWLSCAISKNMKMWLRPASSIIGG